MGRKPAENLPPVLVGRAYTAEPRAQVSPGKHEIYGQLISRVQVKGLSTGKTKYQTTKEREYVPFYCALW